MMWFYIFLIIIILCVYLCVAHPKKRVNKSLRTLDSNIDEMPESLSLTMDMHYSTRVIEIKQKTQGALLPIPSEWINNYVSQSGGFTNYSRYEVSGINPKTKRKNKRIFDCFSEQDAIDHMLLSGFTEPFTVEFVKFDEPTERQLSYANDLGIQIPERASKQDVSALISRVVDDDETLPSEFMVRQAMSRKVMFSRYVGAKTLVSIMSIQLQEKSPKTINEDHLRA